MELDSLRRSIEALNEKIRPIASRPVDFGPDLLQRLENLPDPLDEAGIREPTEKVLTAAIDLYTQSSAEQRQAIRDLFRTNPEFAWAASFVFPPNRPRQFRSQLVWFSIVDQASDARDAVLWLAAISASSTELAEDVVATIRREVAALSSDLDRYGFGSTRDLILHGYGNYARYGAV